MDLLRNLFGSLSSGVIRLAVAVGILAAAYLFIVKPVLDTTDNAFKTTDETIQKSLNSSGFDEIARTIGRVDRRLQREIRHSLRTSGAHGDSGKLVHCIERARGDVQRIRRCTARF